MTGIEWTDHTWNPVTGCDKISPGCAHCYAEEITKRFPKTFKTGFDITLYPERLTQPLKWRKPRKVFVNSMSDLFHEDVPLYFIKQVFEVIEKTPQHDYQILTKRSDRLTELADKLHWYDNVWIGVSVESQKYTHRIDHLRRVPARIRFLSCEPLLDPLELDLTGIHWVIVGGESGRGHRSVKEEWVKDIRDQCQSQRVPFFFKQWGGITPKKNGRLLEGKLYNEFPVLT